MSSCPARTRTSDYAAGLSSPFVNSVIRSDNMRKVPEQQRKRAVKPVRDSHFSKQWAVHNVEDCDVDDKVVAHDYNKMYELTLFKDVKMSTETLIKFAKRDLQLRYKGLKSKDK